MGKRLDDTSAIANTPLRGKGERMETTEIRKIENGYITRRTSYQDGDYSVAEIHSEGYPAPDRSSDAGSESMKRAVDHLNRK